MPFRLLLLLHGSKGQKGKGSLTNSCTSTRCYGVPHFFEVILFVVYFIYIYICFEVILFVVLLSALLKRAQRRPTIHTRTSHQAYHSNCMLHRSERHRASHRHDATWTFLRSNFAAHCQYHRAVP